MKGLWKVISPFAPDQSGAAAVLYELGGIIVICDAGGCAGNVCGFDEPRWFTDKSAVFSAGLRDMDAILGRDERLIDKLCLAAQQIEAPFAAVIGTPVPAVIATDYKAIKKMAEKRLGIPVLTIDTNGMELYDAGASKAYEELFKAFADDAPKLEEGRAGVIGALLLDTGSFNTAAALKAFFQRQGYTKVCCYGIDSELDDIKTAGSSHVNFVISPSGLAAAKQLKERFGTSYELLCPLAPEQLSSCYSSFAGKRILIVHQAVLAKTIRDDIRASLGEAVSDVTVASWFMMPEECREPHDVKLTEENDFIELVNSHNYDIVIGDILLKRAVADFTGEFIDLPHFAVSGRM